MGTPNPPSAIWTLAVDPPLSQDAAFQANATYRAYVDSQTRGLETHVVDSLIGGVVATWRVLDASAPRAAVVGDLVCLAGTVQGTVTLATGTAIAAAGLLFGMVLSPAAPGGALQIGLAGLVPPDVSGLPTSGNDAFAVLDSSVQRTITKTSIGTNDFVVGTVDAAGNLTLRPQLPPATGSGGVSISGTGVALVASGVIQGAAGTVDVSSDTYVSNVMGWKHGGRLQGHINVTHSATGTLDSTHQISYNDSSTGTTITQLPTSPSAEFDCLVVDTGGQATANPITVDPQGAHIWDPVALAFVTTSVTFSQSGVVVHYHWDPTASHWVLISGAPPPPLAAGQILVGQSGADPQPKTVSGDGTLAASGAFTLAASGASAGSYGDATHIPEITVDAKGRITAVAATPIGNGSGVVQPANGGTGVSDPTAHGVALGEGSAPMDFVTLGDGQVLIGQSSGDPAAHSVHGDATLADDGTLTLASTAVTPASYGDSAHVSALTVNSKGLLTAASSVAISLTNANLQTGAYTHITGVGTLTAGATGSGFVLDFAASSFNGQLPAANQAVQSMGGPDVTGTTAAPVVVGIRSHLLPSLSAGFLLFDGSAFHWHALTLSDIGASGASAGQYPSWNGAAWVPATLPGQGPTAWAGTVSDITFGHAPGTWVNFANITITANANGFAMLDAEWLFRNQFPTGTAVVTVGIGTTSSSPDLISRKFILPPPSPVADATAEGDGAITLTWRLQLSDGDTRTFYALAKVDVDYGLTLKGSADIDCIYVSTSLGGGGGGGGTLARTLLSTKLPAAASAGHAIYIDPVSGSDSNDGTIGSPLQTTQFLCAIIFFFARLDANWDVHYTGDDPNAATVGFDWQMLDFAGFTLTVHAAQVVVHTGGQFDSGTITINPAASSGGQRQTAHATDITDWAPYVWSGAALPGSSTYPCQLVDTTGGNSGTVTWIVSGAGSATASLGRPISAGFTSGSISFGDHYQIVRGSTLGLALATGNLNTAGNTGNQIIFDGFTFVGNSGGNPTGAVYSRCAFTFTVVSGAEYDQCYLGSGMFSSDAIPAANAVLLYGCVLITTNTDFWNAAVVMADDTYITGAGLVIGQPNGYATVVFVEAVAGGSGVQLQDNVVPAGFGALTVLSDAQLGTRVSTQFTETPALIWGNGNNHLGLAVAPGAVATVSSTTGFIPTVTGADGDFGFISEGTGTIVQVARAVDNSTGRYTDDGSTASRATTWVNFALAVSSGGFGFQAQWPSSRAALIGTP